MRDPPSLRLLRSYEARHEHMDDTLATMTRRPSLRRCMRSLTLSPRRLILAPAGLREVPPSGSR
eukprot:5376525-Pleurochrysis_carterae.AAC.1